MINYKSIKTLEESINKIKENYSKEEIDKLLGFNSKKEKILSLFSIRYKTCKKLFEKGSVVYGYIYKIEYNFNKQFNYYKTWILISLSSKYDENPSEYSKIAAELNYFLENPPKKHKHLVAKLKNNENEFLFQELPKDIFNDNVFISTSFVKEKTNPNLNIGIVGILINRKISKQLLIIPE